MRKVESDVGSQYILAYCGTLPPDPGHICTLRNGGKDLGILIVQLWPKGSSAAFYSGSHTVDVPRVRAANKTWEVALKQLDDKGCDAKDLQDSFQEGGLCVSNPDSYGLRRRVPDSYGLRRRVPDSYGLRRRVPDN